MHPSSPEPIAELDHLVWAVPELESGIAELEERLGARALPGGRHPGIGTRNALAPLDGRTYLEVLAPDPEQTERTSFGRWLEGLRRPRLVTWAARTPELDAVARAARSAGLEAGPQISMSRQRPDGSELSWRLMELGGEGRDRALLRHRGLLPFFIQWQDLVSGGEHPADSLGTPVLSLEVLELRGPDPAELGRFLDALGLGRQPRLRPRAGGEPELIARLSTPQGRRELR